MEARNPNQDKGHIYRTVRCDVEEASAEAHEDELEALFDTYGKALAAYLELMPVRAPYRTAFRPEDYKAVKEKAPGLHCDLVYAARDRAIQMWRAFEGRDRRIAGTGIPGHGKGYDPAPRAIPMGPRTMPVRFERLDERTIVPSLVASVPVPSMNIPEGGPAPAGPTQGQHNDHRIKLTLAGRSYQHVIVRDVLDGRGGLHLCLAELVRATVGKASVQFLMGDLEDALCTYERVLEMDPGDGNGARFACRDLLRVLKRSQKLTGLYKRYPDLKGRK